MQLLNTVFVADHRAKLRIRKGNLLIENSDDSFRVPIETVEQVILTGRAEITNTTMGTLVERGIRLAAISKSGRIRFVIGGPVSGNVMLRVGQHDAARDEERSLEIARLLVAGKLQNCRRMLLRWAADSRDHRTRFAETAESIGSRLGALRVASTGDEIRGIEGDGTRRYFKMMGLQVRNPADVFSFERRTRRPPRDPFNALLSFIYGLLLVEISGALDAVGLDPQIGFLHKLRPGRPALALDLIEEFRPSVADRLAMRLVNRSQLGRSCFDDTHGGAVYLSDSGRDTVFRELTAFRKEPVWHPLVGREVPVGGLPVVQATLMARHLRGDLDAYPPYVLAG